MKQERFDEIKELYGHMDYVQELLELCKEFEELKTEQSVDCAKLLIEIDQLKKKFDIAVNLLERNSYCHGNEKCRLDHHGYCQSHNLEDVNEEGCTAQLTRDFLKGLENEYKERYKVSE